MSNFKVQTQKDIDVINRVVELSVRLLVGKNDIKKRKEIKNELFRNITALTIVPYGGQGKWITMETPGMCSSKANGTCEVEMYGFIDGHPETEIDTIHEYSHELWHALINYLNYKGTQGKIKETFDSTGKPVYKIAFAGSIAEIDPSNIRNTKTIGKMFSETTVDILTSASLVAAVQSYRTNGTTLDTVFKQKYDKWNDSSTGYSIFTSLTRLWIAAFSNCGNIGYDNTYQSGAPIIDGKVTLSCGHSVYINDYLHNAVYNPLAIEEDYDQIMGNGRYARIMGKLDTIFDEYLRTHVFTNQMKMVVKEFMFELSDFLNARLAYMKSIRLINLREEIAIISSYNRIWNTLQTEYSAFFTEADIEQIRKRAIGFRNKYNNAQSIAYCLK